MSARDRLPLAALGFAVAAALSAWSPLSAPFGALVGAGAFVLSVRAVRRAEKRALPVLAAVISAAAVTASSVVLARTAGVGREAGPSPFTPPPSSEEMRRELDQAADRTRESRERARREL